MDRRIFLRWSACLAVIGAVTFIGHAIGVNATTFALALLLSVLGIATVCGLVEAIAAAIAGTLCFNFFFLEPVGTFTIQDPQNWIALFTFVVTAVVGSRLSTSAKKRALEAMSRQHEMEKLYELSRNLMLSNSAESIAGQIAQRIVQVFEVPGVAVYHRAEGKIIRAGTSDVPVSDDRLRDAALQGRSFHDAATNISIIPLSLGGSALGSIAIQGASISDTALQAVGNVAAIAAERARAEETASIMTAARHNEEMKATLVDALAHEFKTPLTSIKAAASSILDSDTLAQQELVTIIEEEADRLTDLVSETIQIARIESGDLHLKKRPCLLRNLVETALGQLKILMDGREVQLDFPDEPIRVVVDADLIALTVRQLVSNALKYAHPHSPIIVRAVVANGYATTSVEDHGPGIPEKELLLIFEKFYRVHGNDSGNDKVPGTGMGLAIAREIVRAHGGDIRAESVMGKGSKFMFTLRTLEKESA